MTAVRPVTGVRVPVAGRPVLVTGAGPAALAAAAALLDAGAVVTVLDGERPVPALADLAARGRVALHARRPVRADVDGVWLVYPRTGDPDRDTAVGALADAARVLVVPAGAQAAGTPAGGSVTIVGGGPGDPGLITRRGWAALTAADVVVADRLGPVGLLADLPRDPLVIDAAKVPGGRSMPQERINALLVEHARTGRAVVRLKGGDPYVFGRGREEVDACLAAGVPVTVVPGVTSAVAVPAAAGVPVTHRGVTQAFTVVSGHLPPGHPDSQVDWPALARSGATLVLLMAVTTLPAIAAALREAGLPADTPAVVVADGTLPGSRTVRTTLDALPERAAGILPPAVCVIGAVAALGGQGQ